MNYGFQYGTFSAIVLGGQLQKNVWAMFGVFLGESPHFFGRFLEGVWGIFSCGQLQNNSLFKKELTVHVS